VSLVFVKESWRSENCCLGVAADCVLGIPDAFEKMSNIHFFMQLELGFLEEASKGSLVTSSTTEWSDEKAEHL